MGICTKNEPRKKFNETTNNNINDISDQEMWEAFTEINQQKQINQMYIQQQYNLFQNYCSSNGLNSNDHDSFIKFRNGINNEKMAPLTVQTSINNQTNNSLNQYDLDNNYYNNTISSGLSNYSYILTNNLNSSIYNSNNFSNNNMNNSENNNTYLDTNPYLTNKTNNNDIYVKGELTPVLPRKSYNDNLIDNESNKIMNIILTKPTGGRIILALPGNTTINDMFKKYLDKLNLPYSHLGQDLIFLHNGKQIDPFSQLTLFPTFKSNITITVLDREVVNGG